MVLSIEALQDDQSAASFFLCLVAICCMAVGLVLFDKAIDKAIQEMNTNDKNLVEQAKRLRWEDAADLEDKAESTEAKQEIHKIVMRGYHNSEAKCGMI